MGDVKLELNKNGTGYFYIPGGEEKEERVGKNDNRYFRETI